MEAQAVNAPRLETQRLCKSFGALAVATNIDFRLEQGARHALIGPNGAGKTTLFNCISRLARPEAGAIRFDGEMLDPPMFGKALQTLLRAHALHALSETDTNFAIEVLRKLPAQVVRENWPYGVIL